MKLIYAIIKRELIGYFFSPIAYVFITIFIISSLSTFFFLTDFFTANQASLNNFFVFHQWLYLFFVPATGMRLWSEERYTGSIELLLTLPISLTQAVLGKFLAGWIFIATALILTFPIIITIEYLGSPDYGLIISSYIGSFLMAGAYLAISCVTSALTKNQVISFVISVVICFILLIIGWGVFIKFLSSVFPLYLVEAISSFSFSVHFDSIREGILNLQDIIFYFSIIIGSLILNILIINNKR